MAPGERARPRAHPPAPPPDALCRGKPSSLISPEKRMNLCRSILQSLLGFVVAVASFVLGLFIAGQFQSPGSKWLDGVGELIVACSILVCCLAVGFGLHFRGGVLFVSAGWVVVLLAAISSDFYKELVANWHYTALPVAISCCLLLAIRRLREFVRPAKG